MIRSEIKAKFREENPEITIRVLKDSVLNSWLEEGNKEVCIKTRVIVDQNGTTISTVENDQTWDLTNEIPNFYDIDSYPGSGVTYDDKRIIEKTMAQLDEEARNWRSRNSGTPKAYYRRGKWIVLDRAIDSAAEDVKVYSVLIPDAYTDDVAPFNQLTYLEPFHYSLIYYLQKRAKMKIGKSGEEVKALQEYDAYIKWMKKELGGGKYTQKNYVPDWSYRNSSYRGRSYR